MMPMHRSNAKIVTVSMQNVNYLYSLLNLTVKPLQPALQAVVEDVAGVLGAVADHVVIDIQQRKQNAILLRKTCANYWWV